MRFTYYGVLLDVLRIVQNQKMDKMTKNSNGKQTQIPRPARATAIVSIFFLIENYVRVRYRSMCECSVKVSNTPTHCASLLLLPSTAKPLIRDSLSVFLARHNSRGNDTMAMT